MTASFTRRSLAPHCGAIGTICVRLPGTTRDDQVADRDLHRLAVLVAGRRLHLDQALVRARLRGPNLEHLDIEMKFVAGPHRQRPAKLVETRANDAAGRLEVALHEQPHGGRCGMPSTRRQAPEERSACRFLVHMKRLRVELRSKRLDAVLFDLQSSGAVRLTHGKIFEIPSAHPVASWKAVARQSEYILSQRVTVEGNCDGRSSEAMRMGERCRCADARLSRP